LIQPDQEHELMTHRILALSLLTMLPVYALWKIQSCEPETIIFGDGKDAPYFEVNAESEADAVLVIDFKSPTESHQASFPVKRNPRPKKYWIGSSIGHSFAACGGGEDGKGAGFSGSERLDISNDGLCKVGMSYSWRSSKVNGEFKGEIETPWQTETLKDYGNGVSVRAYFRAPDRADVVTP
jgi:hypothetical protein